MSLSNMKIFNVNPEKKPRIKRLSNGEFVSECYCLMGRGLVENYINTILFRESTCGRLVINGQFIDHDYSGLRLLK